MSEHEKDAIVFTVGAALFMLIFGIALNSSHSYMDKMRKECEARGGILVRAAQGGQEPLCARPMP